MSADYVILARKYRPTTFSEVIGQDAVCRTLKQSLATDRLPQAWLFAGPSGVGKTTVARILARALACTGRGEGSADPCDECASCKDVLAGESLDFLEIDGASNNGVDEVRALREHVGFLPQQGARRVILIDEVHMLSTAAFNALLKTLEEPPAHVKFLFATTEPEKVLPTVRARTQRFDFAPVGTEVLTAHLEDVAARENFTLEAGAAAELARLSGGGVRNALALMDQVGADGHVALDELRELSGQALPSHVRELAGHVWARRAREAVSLVDRLVRDGVSLSGLVGQWSTLLRQGVEQASGAVGHDLDLPAEVTMETLLYQGRFLIDLRRELKDEGSAHTLVVLAVAKLASQAPLQNLEDVLRRVESAPVQTSAPESSASTPDEPVSEPARVAEAVSEAPVGKVPTLKALKARLQEDNRVAMITCLNGARLDMAGDTVTVTVAAPFHRDMLEDRENMAVLTDEIGTLAGKRVRVKLAVKQPADHNEEEAFPDREPEVDKRAGISQRVDQLRQMFDGEIE